jgi:hypothetical protein
MRWVRRHQGLSVSLASVAVLLILLASGSLLAAAHFSKLENEQRELTQAKGRLLDEKEQERKKATDAERREAGLRIKAEKGSAMLRQNLYFARMNLIGQAITSPSGGSRIDQLLAPWEPDRWQKNHPDLRRWEWYYFNGL